MLLVVIILLIYGCYVVFPTLFYKMKYKYRKKNNDKVIYLTFDDGPSEYTDKLLDVLDKYKVKASFFCVAEFANIHKDIIKRMKKDKHLICLHSYKHDNAHLMGIYKTEKDFNNSKDIMNSLGVKINYYRPPWGHINIWGVKKAIENKWKIILWDVMAEDWQKNSSVLDIEVKLLRRIEAGDIICLHDGRGSNNAPERTIEAVDKVIPILLNKGFRFETIDRYEEKNN